MYQIILELIAINIKIEPYILSLTQTIFLNNDFFYLVKICVQ
jgi:hypothetical protein